MVWNLGFEPIETMTSLKHNMSHHYSSPALTAPPRKIKSSLRASWLKHKMKLEACKQNCVLVKYGLLEGYATL